MTWSESIKRSLTASLVGVTPPNSDRNLSGSTTTTSISGSRSVDADNMSKEDNNQDNENDNDNDNDTVDTASTAASLPSLDEEDYYAHALMDMDMENMHMERVSSSCSSSTAHIHKDDNDGQDSHGSQEETRALSPPLVASATSTAKRGGSASIGSVGLSFLSSLRSRTGGSQRPRADSLAESLASSLAASVTNSHVDGNLLPKEIRLHMELEQQPVVPSNTSSTYDEVEVEYEYGDDHEEDDLSTIYSQLSATAPLTSSSTATTSCVVIIPSTGLVNLPEHDQEEEKEYDQADDNITDCVDATVFSTDDLTLSTRYLLPQLLRTQRYEQKCRQERQRLSLKLEEEAQQLLLEDLQSTNAKKTKRRPSTTINANTTTTPTRTTSTIRVGLRVQIEKLMCWKHIHIFPKGLFSRKNEQSATAGLQRSSKGVLV